MAAVAGREPEGGRDLKMGDAALADGVPVGIRAEQLKAEGGPEGGGADGGWKRHSGWESRDEIRRKGKAGSDCYPDDSRAEARRARRAGNPAHNSLSGCRPRRRPEALRHGRSPRRRQ